MRRSKLEIKYPTQSRILRVGTDCSGIEAPIQALKQLDIPFSHVFCSDIDPNCIQSIKANYKPHIIFGDPEGPYPNGDITQRCIRSIPPIDLYVCGFPCQPFSTAGKRYGLNDRRGNMFWSCLDVIKSKKPAYFLLENVKGLVNHDKGRTWDIIQRELLALRDYSVFAHVLNTKDYGVPQSRSRLYIVGIKRQCNFEFPSPIRLKRNLASYIDRKDRRKESLSGIRKLTLENSSPKSLFIDLGFSGHTFPNSDKTCPCILAGSCIWCVPMQRKANVKELLDLQSFPTNFKQVVSDCQMKHQIGNSMSVNVIALIIQNMLKESLSK